jgi:hypothetical protein
VTQKAAWSREHEGPQLCWQSPQLSEHHPHDPEAAATWPGLTEDAINKHLKLTPATVMGHMNQKWQNVRSTSKAAAITSDLEDTTVTPAGTEDKTLFVYAAVIDQGRLYTDLTGRFPQRSSKGNWYVMVVYSFD